jgi:hypothetical protein
VRAQAELYIQSGDAHRVRAQAELYIQSGDAHRVRAQAELYIQSGDAHRVRAQSELYIQSGDAHRVRAQAELYIQSGDAHRVRALPAGTVTTFRVRSLRAVEADVDAASDGTVVDLKWAIFSACLSFLPVRWQELSSPGMWTTDDDPLSKLHTQGLPPHSDSDEPEPALIYLSSIPTTFTEFRGYLGNMKKLCSAEMAVSLAMQSNRR